MAFNAAKNNLIYMYIERHKVSEIKSNHEVKEVNTVEINSTSNSVFDLELFNHLIHKSIDMYKLILILTN